MLGTVRAARGLCLRDVAQPRPQPRDERARERDERGARAPQRERSAAARASGAVARERRADAARDERARDEPGDNFVNATLDGEPVPEAKLEGYWCVTRAPAWRRGVLGAPLHIHAGAQPPWPTGSAGGRCPAGSRLSSRASVDSQH